MFTKQDLHLEFKQETGEYPENTEETTYIDWLEERVLSDRERIEELKSEITILNQLN